MVFREAAKKTGAFMLLSAFLALGVVTMLSEDLSPSGNVISPAVDVMGGNWLVFTLGMFIGSLMIGTYFYIAHIEKKREYL